MDLIRKLCSLEPLELQQMIVQYLKEKGYTNIVYNDYYLFAEGRLPVCLCAHLDTVFSYPPTEFYYDREQSVLWSPDGLGADDRAGIYIILKLLEYGHRPSIILTNLEEEGGVGADLLTTHYINCPFKECKVLIQLDRQGDKEAVYYDCNNKLFEHFINNYGFHTERGTFSDISILAPRWKIAAVNLSVGYMYEHSYSEYLNLNHCNITLNKVNEMLLDCKSWVKFKYVGNPKAFIDWEKMERGKVYYDFLNSMNQQKTNTPLFEWTTNESCICCGRPLSADNIRVVSFGAQDDGETYVCDECFDSYFGNTY